MNKLSQFDFKVEHVPGKLMGHADSLSRLIENTKEPEVEYISEGTPREIWEISSNEENNDPQEGTSYGCHQGVVYRKDPQGLAETSFWGLVTEGSSLEDESQTDEITSAVWLETGI